MSGRLCLLTQQGETKFQSLGPLYFSAPDSTTCSLLNYYFISICFKVLASVFSLMFSAPPAPRLLLPLMTDGSLFYWKIKITWSFSTWMGIDFAFTPTPTFFSPSLNSAGLSMETFNHPLYALLLPSLVLWIVNKPPKWMTYPRKPGWPCQQAQMVYPKNPYGRPMRIFLFFIFLTNHLFTNLVSVFELWGLELKATCSSSFPECKFLCVILKASHNLDLHLEMDSSRDSTLSLVRLFHCGIALIVRKSVCLPSAKLIISSIGLNSSFQRKEGVYFVLVCLKTTSIFPFQLFRLPILGFYGNYSPSYWFLIKSGDPVLYCWNYWLPSHSLNSIFLSNLISLFPFSPRIQENSLDKIVSSSVFQRLLFILYFWPCLHLVYKTLGSQDYLLIMLRIPLPECLLSGS